jgi:hypothetical protein
MLWFILAMLLITGLVGFFGSLTPVSGAISNICDLCTRGASGAAHSAV